MIRLGISTACFYPQYLEETVERIARLGLEEIEVFVNTESEFCPAFAKAFARRCEELGLRVLSVHPFTSAVEGMNLFSAYQRRTEDAMAQYNRYFAAAELLGAKYFTFHGERTAPIGSGPAARDNPERRYQVYEKLCGMAREHGLTLAQENVAWCKSADPAFLRALCENIPSLGFTLDLKQANRAGRSYMEYLDAVGPRIVNLHINDFDAHHSCLLPGEGSMPFSDLAEKMQGFGYQGAMLIEVYAANYQDEQQIKKSIAFLRGVGLK